MRRLLLIFALAVCPLAVQAQDWATKEVCTVDTANVSEDAFKPSSFAELEVKGAFLPNGKGRFWRIETASGAVSHLWGTMHSSSPLILDLPDALIEAIENARIVAVEIDFTAQSRAELRDAPFYEARFKGPGDPFNAPVLSNSIAGLSDEHTAWVRERAFDVGWSEDVELILSPAGMAEMLLGDPCEDFTSGVLPIQDDYIQLLGRLAGADILGLEGRFEFLDDLSGPDMIATAEAITRIYAAYLKPMTSNAERSTSFALYRQGRMDVLSAWDEVFVNGVLGAQGSASLRLTNAYLLSKRNLRFVDRVDAELDKGDVVIAVGFAHLAGEQGLVELLRAKGHTVTRVVVPGEAE